MREDEVCFLMSDILKSDHCLFAYRATIRVVPRFCYPLKTVATGRKGTSVNRPLRAGNTRTARRESSSGSARDLSTLAARTTQAIVDVPGRCHKRMRASAAVTGGGPLEAHQKPILSS